MIRRLLAAALAFALPVAAICAPFQHLHPDEHASDHHAGRAAHAHVDGHHTHEPAAGAPAGAAFTAEDHDRAVTLPTAIAVPQAAFDLSPAIVPDGEPLVRDERPAHVSVVVVHGHDPPAASALAPRAPPSFLS